jgi:SNF2 family DNA or RNA helicase
MQAGGIPIKNPSIVVKTQNKPLNFDVNVNVNENECFILIRMEQSMLYQHSLHHGNFSKMVKCCVLETTEGIKSKGDAYSIQLYKNKHLMLHDGISTLKLKVPPYMQDLLISLLRDPNNADTFKIKIYTETKKIWIKFYVNKAYLRSICARFGLAPSILSLIVKQKGNSINKEFKPQYNEKDIVVYQNVNCDAILTNYMKYLKIDPYDYQHNNIAWLRQVEESVKLRRQHLQYVQTVDLLHFQTRNFDVYLDPDTTILYNDDSLWDCPFRCSTYELYGGVLCDEVGLGKTLSMTGLILSDKYRHETTVTKTIAAKRIAVKKDAPVKIKIKAKVLAKPKVFSGKLPIRKTEADLEREEQPDLMSDTEMDESESEAGIKKKIAVKKRDTPIDITTTEKVVESIMASTEATLVLCPRRLVGQWATEIQKYTDKLRVVEISTLTHVKKYTYEDLDNIDIIVTSFSLLGNKSYLAQDDFRLKQIHWRRVIVDEGHEVLLHNLKKCVADLRISTGIFSIKSTYRWVCTGTPLPDTVSSLQAIISYLNDLGHNKISPLLENISLADYKRLTELIFHRNTHQSIKEQISIPKHEEQVEFLEFLPTEKAIYDSVDSGDITRKLQVCTNLSVSDKDNEISGGNVLNLSQVTKAMGAYYMANCDRTEQDIATRKKKITTIKDERDTEVDILEDEVEELKLAKGDKDDIQDLVLEITKIKNSARNRMKTLTNQILSHEEKLLEYSKQLQVFRSLDLTHIAKSTCPIYGTKLIGKVAITPDGYYYSQKGVELIFLGGRRTAHCPCTRKPIELDQLVFVDTEAKAKDTTASDAEVDLERSKWGTKMAHVISRLRSIFVENQDSKVIIFSQWTKMLMLMSKALKDCGINYVFCRGNVHVMSKSIKTFKTDPTTRVILLSSDSCSSGSNLTEASHIFLIDAVGGDIEHARAAETQAIARACRLGQTKIVQVYRFIMRDTVEETYYNKMVPLPSVS